MTGPGSKARLNPELRVAWFCRDPVASRISRRGPTPRWPTPQYMAEDKELTTICIPASFFARKGMDKRSAVSNHRQFQERIHSLHRATSPSDPIIYVTSPCSIADFGQETQIPGSFPPGIGVVVFANQLNSSHLTMDCLNNNHSYERVKGYFGVTR